MASLSKNNSNDTRIISFTKPNGQRKVIYLGKMQKSMAEKVLIKVEAIIASNYSGISFDAETAKWLGDIDQKLHAKLVRVGLVARRSEPDKEREESQLGPWLQRYLNNRSDVKPATMTNWRQTEQNLVEFFGGDKLISEVNAGDAKDFERFLKTSARKNAYGEIEKAGGLSPATVRKRISNSKQFFADAVERGLIDKNPFDKLDCCVRGNNGRLFFVTTELAQKVLAACPDNDWRLIFAMSRYGGLRCPSEHLGLRWSDIDLERGRMNVRSPKTEHHEGKESREVPIFPELRPYLEAARDAAAGGQEYVISGYRGTTCNLRTQFQRILAKAGIKPWPKLFQNLRSTRETELAETFPIHVVCQWIGNSQAVAKKHYLQVTEDHFKQAEKSIVKNDVL